MQLSRKELRVIRKAERAVVMNRWRTLTLILLLLVAGASFFYGQISSIKFALICVGSTVLALLLPILTGPSYQDIVKLLQRVREESDHEEFDPIIRALAGQPDDDPTR